MTTELTKPGQYDRLLARVDGRYRYPARRFVEFVERQGKSMGDPKTWDEYLASLRRVQTDGRMRKRRYSAGTYNLRLAAMKAMLKAALKDSTLGMSDVQARVVRDRLDELRTMKKPAPASYVPEKVMTAAEVRELIERVQLPGWGLPEDGIVRRPHPELAFMLEFLWTTGVRVSEMTGILLTDLRRENDRYLVRIIGKGSKERYQEVSIDLVKRIRDHFQGDTYLFQSRNGGKGEESDYRFTRTWVSQEIHRVGWAILKRRISAHALRHSIATNMIRSGARPKKVQQYLGHSNISTTLTYYVHEEAFTHEELSTYTKLPPSKLVNGQLSDGRNIGDGSEVAMAQEATA